MTSEIKEALLKENSAVCQQYLMPILFAIEAFFGIVPTKILSCACVNQWRKI